jgi:histidine triad (HIT) family protein
MTDGTIFDRIIAKDIPADIVYEDDRALAFRDINPVAPTHVLVIPKRRIATVNDATTADEADLGHLLVVAREVAAKEGVAEDGYRLVMNCNEYGGQSVYHVHLHLIGGQRLGWPPFPDAAP